MEWNIMSIAWRRGKSQGKHTGAGHPAGSSKTHSYGRTSNSARSRSRSCSAHAHTWRVQ